MWIVGIVGATFILVDLFRLASKGVNLFLFKNVVGLMKEKEVHKFSSMTFFMLAALSRAFRESLIVINLPHGWLVPAFLHQVQQESALNGKHFRCLDHELSHLLDVLTLLRLCFDQEDLKLVLDSHGGSRRMTQYPQTSLRWQTTLRHFTRSRA